LVSVLAFVATGPSNSVVLDPSTRRCTVAGAARAAGASAASAVSETTRPVRAAREKKTCISATPFREGVSA
jgi:hypothetical protein